MIIAIDGPAASGKGALARRIARHYGLAHLDTGMLYRAVARDLLASGASLGDTAAAVHAARALDLTTLEDRGLRGRQIGEAASVIAAIPDVRAELLTVQRNFAERPGDFAGHSRGAVLEGRDIGTVVCPDADIKLYVTADLGERARRRNRDLAKLGESVTELAVLEDLRRRDERDSSRAVAPLRQPEGALLLDTTKLDIEAAFFAAVRLIDAAIGRAVST
jgi:CMP/dCMP kinase